MLAFEALPPPSDAATIALIGLVLLFWVAVRVHILRRTMERLGPEAPPPAGAAWLRKLAAWPGAYPVLAVAAAGLLVLLLA